jgi:hypothetical protein
MDRVEKLVASKEELFEHLTSIRTHTPEITKILAARIHPDFFIDDVSARLLRSYNQFKSYGMAFLYANNEVTPNYILEAFDTISNQINQYEVAQMKKATSRSKEEDRIRTPND